MQTPVLVVALAALSGSAIGGAASFLSSWLGHSSQVRTKLFLENKGRREDLYREFIEETSQCYIDALTRDSPDLPKAIRLYALINRMRVLSTPEVINHAERVARTIVNTYTEPNKSFEELRLMVEAAALDPLRDFSEACRSELEMSATAFRIMRPAHHKKSKTVS